MLSMRKRFLTFNSMPTLSESLSIFYLVRKREREVRGNSETVRRVRVPVASCRVFKNGESELINLKDYKTTDVLFYVANSTRNCLVHDIGAAMYRILKMRSESNGFVQSQRRGHIILH